MHSGSCSFCLEWTDSEENVANALRGRWRASASCVHQPLMQVAINQLRKGLPIWWVVGGEVIVPIWAVEVLKKRARLLSGLGSISFTISNKPIVSALR